MNRIWNTLVPVLLGVLLPAVAARGQYNYTTNNGAITIVRYTGKGGVVNITNRINNLPVTTIGVGAFANNPLVTALTIPDSVTTIADYAFEYCTSVTNLTIGAGVTTIGHNAFLDCFSVTSLAIPNSVVTIGDGAFYGCGLTRLTIGKGVTSIGNYAFEFCSGLTTVAIPSNVVTIGDSAFAFCSGLTGISIPDNVTSLGDNAFAGCAGLFVVTIGDGVTNLPASVFAACTSLISVTLSNQLLGIGDQAFASCFNLSTITIPESVLSIGDGAFFNCPRLTELHFLGNAPSAGADLFATPSGTNDPATVYFLPGATGWGPTFGGLPTASSHSPIIVTPPLVTNAFAVINGLTLVLAGRPADFDVGVTDPNGLAWTCSWDFGNGASSSVCNPTYVYTNCGPLTATVTVDDGATTPAKGTCHVVVPCELTVNKLGIGLNFARANADTIDFAGKFELPGITNVSQLAFAQMVLGVGGVRVLFTLDDKGRGASASAIGSCKFSYQKASKTKPGRWTAKIRLVNGNWRDQLSAYGLTNATIAPPGHVVTVPVLVVVDNEASAAEPQLHYTAGLNKTGRAK